MISIGLLAAIYLIEAIHAQQYKVVIALNCGSSTEIKTYLVTYKKDEFYSEGTRTIQKSYLPRTTKEERALLKTERSHSDSFSYSLPLEQDNRYGIGLKFMEQTYTEVGTRVFNVKLGDDVVFTIDIFKEAGSKRPTTRFFYFTLRRGIVYLNHSQAALNAYNYKTKKVIINFEKIKGDPKVYALVLVSDDIASFRRLFEEKKTEGYTHSKSEFTCYKIYNVKQQVQFGKPLYNPESIHLAKQLHMQYYLEKIFSIKGLLSFLIFLLMRYKDSIKECLLSITRVLQRKLASMTLKKKYKKDM